MARVRVVDIREETGREKALDQWFEQGVLASPERLDAGGRTILGLVTGLLGVLFTVLAVTEDPLPSYFAIPLVRWLGMASVGALLLALAGTLGTLLPRRVETASGMPDEQAEAFRKLLARKSRWLTMAAITFVLGLAALGAVLIIALLTVV